MSVMTVVQEALKRGMPRPGFFAFRGDEMDRFDLGPLMRAPRRRRDMFLAAIAGRTEIQCVALLGVLRMGGAAVPAGGRASVVFVEWPDNRWWSAWAPIPVEGVDEPSELTVRTAEDGWPRPGGMGGWFSLARRTGVRLHVHPSSGTIH
jgi:hypothetical protein